MCTPRCKHQLSQFCYVDQINSISMSICQTNLFAGYVEKLKIHFTMTRGIQLEQTIHNALNLDSAGEYLNLFEQIL